MKKLMMGACLAVLAVSAVNVSAVSTSEWEKWQNDIQSTGNYSFPELCKIKDYLSNYQSGLSDYISDLKTLSTKSTGASSRLGTMNKLLSFFASLTKREKDKFKTIVDDQQKAVLKINPNAKC